MLKALDRSMVARTLVVAVHPLPDDVDDSLTDSLRAHSQLNWFEMKADLLEDRASSHL